LCRCKSLENKTLVAPGIVPLPGREWHVACYLAGGDPGEDRMGAEPNLRALRQAPFRGLRFGAFEIDLDSAELWKAGARVKLQLQPFRVLALLASQPGRLL